MLRHFFLGLVRIDPRPVVSKLAFGAQDLRHCKRNLQSTMGWMPRPALPPTTSQGRRMFLLTSPLYD
jgi:hypothetical protein